MRKTEYFTSDPVDQRNFEQAVLNVKKKRDDFLSRNHNIIEDIIEERIDCFSASFGNHCIIYAIITFAFFEKSRK